MQKFNTYLKSLKIDFLTIVIALIGTLIALYSAESLQEIALSFHNQILNYEDHYNHHLLTINDETPLLDLLKEKTYLDSLQLDDYFNKLEIEILN